MQNINKSQSEIAFAFQTGVSCLEIKEKFNLTDEEFNTAHDLFYAGNDLELVKLALSKKIQVSASNVEEENAGTPPVLDAAPLPPPTHGYEVRALGRNVFIRPLPKEHEGRLITPPAYESNSDSGFIHSVGPEVIATVLRPGLLVLFDKFAETGARYQFVVDGEITELVMVREEFILAVLERVRL